MKLSVRGPGGKVEFFTGVDDWSFAFLRKQVIERFDLKCDFTLFFGNHKLPADDILLSESDLGFVDGDRLRLVLNDKELSPSDHASTSCRPKISQDDEKGSNSRSANANGTVYEVILSEMKKKDFELTERDASDLRWKFRHPKSALIVEIDYRVYCDRFAKYIHVTPSIYHPSQRRFIDPVILEEKSVGLRGKVSENLVLPIQLAVIGHDNPFLRLLGQGVIVEHLFKMIPPRCILRLERTNKYLLELCRSGRMEMIWKILYERDFGRGVSASYIKSYRELYKQAYIQRLQEYNFHPAPASSSFGFIFNPPNFIQPGNPPFGPDNPDPDMPEGPFQRPSPNPFLPPENPFPLVPRPANPLDPFRGGEILPSRPTRPRGTPRQFSLGSRFLDREDFIFI